MSRLSSRTKHNSQWLQTPNPKPRRQHARDKRQHRRPRLPNPADPPEAAGEEPRRERLARLGDHDGVHGAEEEADDGDGDGVLDEGGDLPDGDFEAEELGVRISEWRR